jgi:hypothetical protein
LTSNAEPAPLSPGELVHDTFTSLESTPLVSNTVSPPPLLAHAETEAYGPMCIELENQSDNHRPPIVNGLRFFQGRLNNGRYNPADDENDTGYDLFRNEACLCPGNPLLAEYRRSYRRSRIEEAHLTSTYSNVSDLWRGRRIRHARRPFDLEQLIQLAADAHGLLPVYSHAFAPLSSLLRYEWMCERVHRVDIKKQRDLHGNFHERARWLSFHEIFCQPDVFQLHQAKLQQYQEQQWTTEFREREGRHAAFHDFTGSRFTSPPGYFTSLPSIGSMDAWPIPVPSTLSEDSWVHIGGTRPLLPPILIYPTSYSTRHFPEASVESLHQAMVTYQPSIPLLPLAANLTFATDLAGRHFQFPTSEEFTISALKHIMAPQLDVSLCDFQFWLGNQEITSLTRRLSTIPSRPGLRLAMRLTNPVTHCSYPMTPDTMWQIFLKLPPQDHFAVMDVNPQWAWLRVQQRIFEHFGIPVPRHRLMWQNHPLDSHELVCGRGLSEGDCVTVLIRHRAGMRKSHGVVALAHGGNGPQGVSGDLSVLKVPGARGLVDEEVGSLMTVQRTLQWRFGARMVGGQPMSGGPSQRKRDLDGRSGGEKKQKKGSG